MSVTIKSERDLKRKVKALREYVEECVRRVMDRGYVLKAGSWSHPPLHGVQGTCCAVGAIGVATLSPRASRTDTAWGMEPSVVVPLIRNGATELIDEPTLDALSDGFEWRRRGRDVFRPRPPRKTSAHSRYRRAAYDLGRELYEKHCKEPA